MLLPFILLPLICSQKRDSVSNIPTFYDQYEVRGYIKLPYIDLVEQFSAKYDSKSNSSLISYYHDTSFSARSGKYGPMTIIPASFDGRQTMTCIPGGSLQSVFPDLTTFKRQNGTHDCRRTLDCYLWLKEDQEMGRNNTYKFFTDYDLQPVRYEMMGYDTLFGSHYDEYAIEYTRYTRYAVARTDLDIYNIISKYCKSDNDESQSIHIDLISEIFDTKRAQKIHKMHFEATISKYSLKFPTKFDYLMAQNNHQQNLRFIMAHNRQNKGYKLSLNHRAVEQADNQIRCRLRTQGNSFITKHHLFGGFHERNQMGSELPRDLDWRTSGVVSPVKDQAICGSCWAFGTTGVFEAHYSIKTNASVAFSEQHLVDCSWSQGNNGCFGGLDVNSYTFIKKYGLATTDQYGPYRGQDMICKKLTPASLFELVNFKLLPPEEETIMSALYHVGPLSISIDASPKTFSFYHSGVYDDPKCSSVNLDHAVLLVGYGTTEGKTYWLVKNSWSTHWGDNGYIKISRNNNTCGVMTAPTYPILN